MQLRDAMSVGAPSSSWEDFWLEGSICVKPGISSWLRDEEDTYSKSGPRASDDTFKDLWL